MREDIFYYKDISEKFDNKMTIAAEIECVTNLRLFGLFKMIVGDFLSNEESIRCSRTAASQMTNPGAKPIARDQHISLYYHILKF